MKTAICGVSAALPTEVLTAAEFRATDWGERSCKGVRAGKIKAQQNRKAKTKGGAHEDGKRKVGDYVAAEEADAVGVRQKSCGRLYAWSQEVRRENRWQAS